MISANNTILGTAIFFTYHGLEAIGTGVLAGVRNTPAIFEFRTFDYRSSIFSTDSSAIIFRRSINIKETGTTLDLIGVASPGFDSASRQGFFGYCVAVKSCDVNLYPEAYDHVANRFKEITENVLSNGKIKKPALDILKPLEADSLYSSQTYTLLGKKEGSLILHLEWKDQSSLDLLFKAIKEYLYHPSNVNNDIIIVEQPLPGSVKLDEPYLRELENRAREFKLQSRSIAKRTNQLKTNNTVVPEDTRLLLENLMARIDVLELHVRELQEAQLQAAKVSFEYPEAETGIRSLAGIVGTPKKRSGTTMQDKNNLGYKKQSSGAPYHFLDRFSINPKTASKIIIIFLIVFIVFLFGYIGYKVFMTNKETDSQLESLGSSSTSSSEIPQDATEDYYSQHQSDSDSDSVIVENPPESVPEPSAIRNSFEQ